METPFCKSYKSPITQACVTSLVLLKSMKKSIKDDLIDGFHQYSFIIRGKGQMSGKQFADECRKVYSDKNPVNAHFYTLFENHIELIERTYSQIHVKYRLS
jgi:hypothetical protein